MQAWMEKMGEKEDPRPSVTFGTRTRRIPKPRSAILKHHHPLQLSEESLDSNTKRATSNIPGRSGEVFVPRNAPRPRAGLGLKKTSKKASIPHDEPVQSGTATEGKSQDDFRKLLG